MSADVPVVLHLTADQFDERGGCLPDPDVCSCPGHKMPGVAHMRPCCNEPHMEETR